MKVVGSKSISSPGRGGAERYPPPLIMRLLRSNVGSKSRGGRTRSSPMFVVRKKNIAGVIENQEPSSPKVTCIGQVRVRRRSSKNNFTRSKSSPPGTCPCFSVPTSSSTCTPRKPNLQRWVSFLRCWKNGDNSSKKIESDDRSHFNDNAAEVTGNEEDEVQIEEEGSKEVFKGACTGTGTGTTPPKNALLLTRCRSAPPFRSSSLAVQFWGETNNDIGGDQQVVNNTSCCCDFENQSEKQFSRKLRIGEEEESEEISAIRKQVRGGLINRRNMEIVGMPHPLILTRCKSEPSAAKTGEEQQAKQGCIL